MHLPSAPTILAARSLVVAGVIGLSAVLTACGSSDSNNADADSSQSGNETAEASAALTVTDPWIKATDESMTAVFGTLVNHTDEEITVVAASTEVAGLVELHEVVSDGSGGTVMQPKSGGFTIPAGGTHELVAGGDHIMVMELDRELSPGEEVDVTLELADGSTLDVTALVKPFSGADEEYAEGHGEDTDHGDHGDHGDGAAHPEDL